MALTMSLSGLFNTAHWSPDFANPANALRTGVGYLADVAREISAATRQRRAGVVPRMDRGGFYPFLRAATTVSCSASLSCG